MDIQKLIKRYGSQQAVAAALGVTKGAVSQWVKAGAIPAARLWQIKAGAVKPPKGREWTLETTNPLSGA
jgi:DNA-binding transcriptional regulator YdaS (Cro superfamily)